MAPTTEQPAGLTASIAPVERTSTYDGAMPCIYEFPDGLLTLVYRQADAGHVDSTGRIVRRHSTDGGQSWTNETTVVDVKDRDTAAPSLLPANEQGKQGLFCQYRPEKNSSVISPNRGILRLIGRDSGRRWGDPEDVTDQFTLDQPHPFGGGVSVEGGWLTAVYNSTGSALEVARLNQEFSIDRTTIVARNDDSEERRLTEPCMATLGQNRVLLVGRDDATGDFFTIRSRDGGSSWGNPRYFNPLGASTPTPIWIHRQGNYFSLAWGDRDRATLNFCRVRTERFWSDPACLQNQTIHSLHASECTDETLSYWEGGAGDFGYPSLHSSKSTDNLHLAFYDGHDRPNIWTGRIRRFRND